MGSMGSKLIAASLLACVLAACGGGDGGGNAGDPPPAIPPNWQGTQLLEGAGNHDSSDVDVALGADGVGHAVWSRRVGTIDVIFHARYVNGTWSAAELIAGPGDIAVAATGKVPKVVALPSGDALVTWLNGTSVMSSRTVNGQWQELAEIQNGAGVSTPGHLRMATDGAGRAVAIWQRDGVVFASSFSGGALQAGVVRISDNTVDAKDEIDVAMDSSGRALAVWLELAPGDAEKKVMSRLSTNGVWSPTSASASGTFGSVPGGSLELAVAIDASGDAAVVWTERFASGDVLLRGARGSGTTWSALKTVSGTGFVVKGPDLARRPDGEVMVVFARRALDDDRFDVVARPAISSGTALAVETDDAGNAQAPQVAFDTAGQAMAVWMQSDGTRTNVLFNRIDPDTGQWGAPQAIESDSTGDALAGPALAVNANGGAIAAWQHRVTDADGVHAGVMANVFK